MAYPMYGNSQYYMQNLQDMRDRIDAQIKNYQQSQMQQPVQPITQNFQIAPQQNNNELESKYAENIEEVKNTFVIKTGIFIKKDLSTLWVKDVSGKIRTFTTEEVIEMDEKDKEIYRLKKQIEELRNEYDNTNSNEPITEQKPTRVSSGKKSNAN